MGQSTISTHLATLEARLGFRLCERGRSGFRLTAKGSLFVDSSRQLLNTLNDFSISVRNMDRKLVGHLTIGLIDHLPVEQTAKISRAIARFHRRDQAVKFSVTVRSPRDLEEGVLNGQNPCRLWILLAPSAELGLHKDLRGAPDRFCGREHPMYAQAGTVTVEEAAQEEWAWRSYPLPEARQSTSLQRVTAVADDMGAVAVLVMSGRHLAYLPEHFASPYIKEKFIVALNPLVLRYDVPFHMATLRSASRNDVLQAFLEDFRLAVAPDVPGTRGRRREAA